MRTYVDACKAGDAIVHVDATGSVISNMLGQRRLLYYCFLVRSGSLPILDILTTRHSGDWLHSLLVMFNSSVRQINRGSVVTPKQVVTDFSYALVSACMPAFNRGMTIDSYLNFTHRCILRQCTLNELHTATFLTLCMAHMLKALSVRMHKLETRKSRHQLRLTS